MKRNPWPLAIILYFTVFIAGMIAWIFFAVRNDQELVRKDYYEHELRCQGELESFARAAFATAEIRYDKAAQTISIALPEKSEKATAFFYRPSNATADRRIDLVDGTSIDVAKFERGLWKLRISWTNNQAEFRRDETLVLAER